MILRRLQVIEAMNYCERRGWLYNLSWSIHTQYIFSLPFDEWAHELQQHLVQWEKE